jgi:ATP synthase F1 delta subunit
MSFSKKIVTTYSKSLFQSVTSLQKDKTKVLSIYSIGEELNLLLSLLVSSKQLKTLFSNPTISEKKKLELLISIFPGISKMMSAFLKILTERSHLSLLPEISEQYNETLLKFKGFTTVRLITASTLQENYGLFLLKTLKNLTNSKEVILNVSYNPQLLGGLILEYNSTSTDASLLKEFSLFFNEG